MSSSQGGRVMVIVGLVLAVASLMGAVRTAMWGLNIAYERREQRNFIRRRVSAFLMIVGSALFGVYASRFSSYNKTWGSLSAVIVTLTWLWLCSVAILFAAEINAEVERTGEIMAGARPSDTLTAQHK